MDGFVHLLEPWCRELRGVLEAVPVNGKENYPPTDMWQLRVALPRQSKYTMQPWSSRRSRAASSDTVKLQRIREGLDLLWLLRAIDEPAWTWILVNRCGVGGFDNPMWTSDAQVLPVLHLQPYLVDTIADVLDALEQCHQLLVTLQDDENLGADFHAAKRKLLPLVTTELPTASYRVSVSNWLSPNTLLSAEESTQMWKKVGSLVCHPGSVRKAGTTEWTFVPMWNLVSLDVHMIRSVVTFESALALLGLAQQGVHVNELRIDLLDRADDELTPSGFGSVLAKLFSGPSPPRHLHVDCENANIARLHQLAQVLQSTTSPITLTLQRFGLSSVAGLHDRQSLFKLLGVCLRQKCLNTVQLDIPEFLSADLLAMATAYTEAERSGSLSSLKLTIDCRRDSWVVVEKMLSLMGRKLETLELRINGGDLSDNASMAVLSLCPRLRHLKLDRLNLGKQNPLVTHLRQPTSALRSLSLSRLHAPLQVINDISRTIADPTYPCYLEALHLDLSDIANISDEVVSGLSSALHENKSVRVAALVLDSDAAASLSDPVHDEFYNLHNQRLEQSLPRRSKLAVLSVLASSKRPPTLSQLPLTLIFQFAASKTRRRVSIRESGTAW